MVVASVVIKVVAAQSAALRAACRLPSLWKHAQPLSLRPKAVKCQQSPNQGPLVHFTGLES